MQDEGWRLQPEDRIGLAFSGGGHRATLFALGGLMYLADTGAHRRVKSFSSVSGGSLLNGYLGLLDTSLAAMEVADFEAVARKLASCIAGRPSFWRAGLVLLIATLLASIYAVLRPTPTGIAMWMLLSVATVAIGRLAGGSLWGWWGTWAYAIVAGCLACSVFALASVALMSKSYVAALAMIVALVASGYAFRQRGRVTARAFGATICAIARPGHAGVTMSTLRHDALHVFCATEMHGGRHCYFTREFVYSPGIGVGYTDRIPLRSVMQASASFPGAFPFQRMSTSALRFCVWDMLQVKNGPKPALPNGKVASIDRIENLPANLLLTDGGVNDNLGLSWYTAGREFGRRIDRWIDEMANNCRLLGGGRPLDNPVIGPSIRLGLNASAAMHSQPDVTIVFNAGAPRHWADDVSARVVSVVEGLELYATVIATYTALQEQTCKRYIERLRRKETRGAMVELGLAGVRLASYGERPTAIDMRWNELVERIPWPRDLLIELSSLAEKCGRVSTTLNPLGKEQAADLLWYGYLQTMVCLTAELGLDLYEMPARDRFAALVEAPE